MASFCLDQLVPEKVDLLIIEYAINDGLAGKVGTASTLGGQRLSPQGAMERLLRRVLRLRPHTMPLILYVCRPDFEGVAKPCEGLYSPVARHYGVPEVAPPRRAPFTSPLVLPPVSG